MNPLLRLLLWASSLLLWLPALCPAKEEAVPRRQPLQALGQPFDIDFRSGKSPAPDAADGSSEMSNDDAVARAYHILGMPLNAFLQAMAQRAGANYIPTPDVQGTVSSVFYDLDPVSMAKAGARVNGYQLEALDGVFMVHRISATTESQPSQNAFRQRKSSLPPPLSSSPATATPSPKPVSAFLEGTTHARSIRPQPGAFATSPHPPRKIPVAAQSSVSVEEKKLVALAKKLARQKEEQKALVEQERQLHRRLLEEERALESQRKATEKALREQLSRVKKAAAPERHPSAGE